MQSVDAFKIAGDYERAQAKFDSRGEALLALAASLLWPGLGQFFAGRRTRIWPPGRWHLFSSPTEAQSGAH